jgi:hypothetical protein
MSPPGSPLRYCTPAGGGSASLLQPCILSPNTKKITKILNFNNPQTNLKLTLFKSRTPEMWTQMGPR